MIHSNKIYILLTILAFQLLSCSKDNTSPSDIDSGNTIIKVNTPLIGLSEEKNIIASTAVEDQEEIINLGDGSFLLATLKPILNNKNNIQKLASETSIGNSTQALPAGKRYRIIVYTANGDYLLHRDYTAGKESQTEALSVSGGREFIFVSYSINSDVNIPETKNMDKLSSAMLSNISEDLMYYKDKVFIKEGVENKLDIKLYHKFSAITTTLKLTEEGDQTGKTTSNIYNVNDLIFSNLSATGGINFKNDEVTFSAINANNQKVSSLANTTNRYAITKETVLITPATNQIKLLLPAITLNDRVNEYTTGNAVVTGLKATPGYKYNLVLKLFKPNTELVKPVDDQGKELTTTFFSVGSSTSMSPTSKDFTFPGTDFGFTFDVTLLDNSFNITINEVNLFSKELEFQIAGDLTPNITFQDGTYWEDGIIQDIWKLRGTESNPIVRVVIDQYMNVSLFGSKVSGGPLYPLKLKTGTTINTNIKWNTTTTNKVKFTQKATNITQMQGYGKGYKIIK